MKTKACDRMLLASANDCGMERGPIVIVAGFMRCGMATTMAMLEAGGMPIAGGAHPPTYELPQMAHRLEDLLRPMFAPYGIADQLMSQLPAPMLNLGSEFDPAWIISSCRGKAVKLVNPHLLPSIPQGDFRAIWLDRNEQDRARSILRDIGSPEIGLFADIIANYFTAARPAAREALRNAGATILDVQHADLTGSPDRCRATVDSIVEFIGLPLDRAAMVKRSEVARW